MTPPLTAFILERIDEDEATAQGDETRARKWSLGGGYPQRISSVGNALLVAETFHDPDSVNWPGEHIVRWDPARVLAECEAKRRLLALHEFHKATEHAPPHCLCQDDDGLVYDQWPCETIRLLALPYASHPDYLEAWRA